MKLSIDSTNNLKTIISIDEQTFEKTYDSPRDQNVMGAIKEALDQTKTKLDQVTEIEVNSGPGSFTGIRVGISIAQTLAFCFNIPVNGQKATTPLGVNYGEPPAITVSNKISIKQ